MAVDALGRPVRLLTPGQAHESTRAEALPADLPAGRVVAGRGHDSDRLVARLEGRGTAVVIPPRSTSPRRPWSRELYEPRDLVERAICRPKRFRRVATRYDGTARSYAAFVHVAAITWMR